MPTTLLLHIGNFIASTEQEEIYVRNENILKMNWLFPWRELCNSKTDMMDTREKEKERLTKDNLPKKCIELNSSGIIQRLAADGENLLLPCKVPHSVTKDTDGC